MKFENCLKEQTLEHLENHVWPKANDNLSRLEITCNTLRKKPLKDFTVEEFRVMISQNLGLPYLMPLAIEILREDIMAQGDFYEGDLLKCVLTSDKTYWIQQKDQRDLICNLFEKNRIIIEEIDTTIEIKKELFDSFELFKNIG